LRSAWRRGGPGSPLDRATVAVSAGLVAASLSFAILPLHPGASWWLYPPLDSHEDDSDIWLIHADGVRQTRLFRAGNDVEYSLPTWSPDGSRLAGTGWDLAAASGPAAFLWVAAADGSGYRRITNAPGWQWIPAWSSDGQWIAYTATPVGAAEASAPRPAAPEPGRAPDGQTPATSGEDIWAVRPDGSGARLLIGGPGDDSGAAWSPDGQRLAFVAGRDGNSELYVAAADGSGQRRLTDHLAADWSPAWSPDSRQLAFTSDRAGSEDVWIVAADGSNPRQLTSDGASDTVPVWSPDGRRIAFVSDRTGDVDVWSMASDGTDLKNLTESPSSNDGQWSVAWSRNGTIAYPSGSEPATELPAIREDLAVAGTILNALLIGAVAAVLWTLRPIVGATAVLLGMTYGLASLVGGDWRLAAAAIVLGLLADFALRALPGRYRLRAAGALTAGGFAAVPVVVLGASGSLYWTATLALGVVLLAGLVGWIFGNVASAARMGADAQNGAASHRQVGVESP
jgi:TolB protein